MPPKSKNLKKLKSKASFQKSKLTKTEFKEKERRVLSRLKKDDLRKIARLGNDEPSEETNEELRNIIMKNPEIQKKIYSNALKYGGAATGIGAAVLSLLAYKKIFSKKKALQNNKSNPTYRNHKIYGQESEDSEVLVED